MKIAAVIVTFNRLNLLKELISALQAQSRKPDGIIVVNNSSTDGTLDWLNSLDLDNLTIVTQANSGSSGGQYTSIKTAFELGYDYIWVMDDDVIPRSNCLENLAKHAKNDRVVAPLRYQSNGEPFYNEAISYNLSNPFRSFWISLLTPDDLDNELIPAMGLTFEGPLMPRELVQTIGLPEKKFFIYADDTEYFIRANKNGFETYIVRSACSDRKLEYISPAEEFSWKQFYVIRNIIAIDVLHGSPLVRFIRPLAYLIKWLGRCRKAKEASTVIKAFLAGYFYRSGN